jgi:hypothetical protein
MAKSDDRTVELAKAFIKSKGEVYKQTTVPENLGIGICEALMIVEGAERLELGEEDIVACVDRWQKERNLGLTKAMVKNVAEEVRHYAKDNPE